MTVNSINADAMLTRHYMTVDTIKADAMLTNYYSGLPHYNAIHGVHRNRPCICETTCYNEVIYIRTIGN